MSEPHHRWGVGALFDNVRHYGGSLWAVNRGTSGTGHGWSGANIVFWNCTSALIAVQSPPTAENFAIGLGGVPDRRPIDIGWIRRQPGEDIEKRPDTPAHGSGHIEHPHNPVEPRSLYLHQLQPAGQERNALPLKHGGAPGLYVGYRARRGRMNAGAARLFNG